MAKILSDREIKRVLGDVIQSGEASLINPHGIELRLGKHVRFLSTGEDKELQAGQFLKVSPGETVLISSLERIDFSSATARKHFPDCMLMGWISPTTTMMREGISQVTTKVDAGFRGVLNWSLRNSSNKDLVLQYAESIYKLTIFRLEKDESPEAEYGEGAQNQYQDTEGIKRSSRRIPADLPKSKLVSSSFEKLDPRKQLKEAGYPFDHIATELTDLHGKFEVVSTDVRLLKDQFEKQTKELSGKIETETKSLFGKIEQMEKTLLEKFGDLFNQRFLKIVGVIVGAVPIMYGSLVFLKKKTTLTEIQVGVLCAGVGIVIIVVTGVLTRQRK